MPLIVDRPRLFYSDLDEIANDFPDSHFYSGMGSMVGVSYPEQRSFMWFNWDEDAQAFRAVIQTPMLPPDAVHLEFV